MQRDNDAVGINYSHKFMKRGDAISPHLSQGAFSITPTDAEFDAAFGATAAEINTVSDPFLAVIDVSGAGTSIRLVVATNDFWFFSPVLTKAT